jgi:hypothetical protein
MLGAWGINAFLVLVITILDLGADEWLFSFIIIQLAFGPFLILNNEIISPSKPGILAEKNYLFAITTLSTIVMTGYLLIYILETNINTYFEIAGAITGVIFSSLCSTRYVILLKENLINGKESFLSGLIPGLSIIIMTIILWIIKKYTINSEIIHSLFGFIYLALPSLTQFLYIKLKYVKKHRITKVIKINKTDTIVLVFSVIYFISLSGELTKLRQQIAMQREQYSVIILFVLNLLASILMQMSKVDAILGNKKGIKFDIYTLILLKIVTIYLYYINLNYIVVYVLLTICSIVAINLTRKLLKSESL